MAVYNKKEILEMYDNDTLKHISLFPLGLSIFDDGIIVDRYHNIIDKNKLSFWCDICGLPLEFPLKSELITFPPYIDNFLSGKTDDKLLLI
jgi:hypothetical protein